MRVGAVFEPLFQNPPQPGPIRFPNLLYGRGKGILAKVGISGTVREHHFSQLQQLRGYLLAGQTVAGLQLSAKQFRRRQS
ncbi:hypothetical protein D3C76_750790 [compost metagenome]